MLSASVALASYDFGPSTLKVGSKGEYVKTLQTLVGATADGSFGPMTAAKVKVWQAANGLTADGLFGAMSKAKANEVVSTGGTFPAGCTSAVGYSSTTGVKCDSTTPSTPSTDTLTGTVGSLVYTLTSGLSNEEVGEGATDVKVAGLKLDATDSDSDVSLSAVKLNFDRGTAAVATDLNDVATEVSLWLGSTEVARVDADVFTDDNNFEKTVSLSGAVVKKGTKADLYVKLSGVSNLDTSDVSDTWTVDFTQVRFVDAQGVTTTENPNTGVKTFSFNTFASSNNVELYAALKSGAEDINETHIINVDDTSDTEDVSLLSFTLKAKGDSDVLVKSLPVLITVTGTGNTIDGMVSTVDLYHGSTKIGSESTTAVDADDIITFDNLDLTIGAGDTETFTVKATILGLDSGVDAGDTIKAELTATQVDAIDAEDETGENLSATELTGTALGEASSVQDIGISVKLVSTTATKTAGDPGATTPTSDEGNFSITFDVTAFDGDVWLDKTAPTEAGTAESQISDNGTGTLVATLTSASNLTGTDGFTVLEDTTERCTIDAHTLATASGYFKLSITDLIYALTDVTGDVAYTSNLDTFKTDQLYLTAR
ncbi:MAG: peptidoglycan-binding domain-containing protein [Thermoplasmata archaeon]|nr:peptidoglycan-binding domain-containing protein [Thermoplasmata archaeon]